MLIAECIGIAIVIALIIAFIGTSSLRSELQSVRTATEANIYLKDGSFNLTKQDDIYVCKKVDKTAKPKPQQQAQR